MEERKIGENLGGELKSGATSEKLTSVALKATYDEIREVYLSDNRPWVVGYSGGKDSTTALQLTWYALSKLQPEQRSKPIYVIASDTLVETPVIVNHIDLTLERINSASKQQGLPFVAHKVRPEIADSFWVNMLGRGYPAPNGRFRWCTDRLKIQPANRFILERVAEFGEVVLVLGVRRSESAARAQVMALHKRRGQRLSRHSDLTNAWVYTPIEDWDVNDVWQYLLSAPSPWGNRNRDLVTMYRNAQAGECPLVVDKTTPSCGNSRFGCWVCTVVERDHSMEALIENGEAWMQPLLNLRDWLASTQDPSRKKDIREVRRRDGHVHLWGENDDKVIWGPYKMEVRREILRRLLRTQKLIQETNPGESFPLISEPELHEIRRIWRAEEGDWEDSVPTIFKEVYSTELEWIDDDVGGPTQLDLQVLEEVCADLEVPCDLMRELIDTERQYQALARRSGIYEKIDTTLKKDWRRTEDVLAAIGIAPVEAAEDAS